MGIRGSLRALLDGGDGPKKMWSPEVVSRRLSTEEAVGLELARFTASSRVRPWRMPTVSEALGVPANQRAVALISSTTGMLTVSGYQNGALMDTPPRLIIRPDPFQTPYAFYSGTAANMAKYGEFIWWIASRDAQDFPSALILAPLNEVTVTENTDNRLFPRYQWGNRTGTRYSAANPRGDFVHVMYPVGEPFALRGRGPLQMCGAASSVAVEAQEWAANFYADGGNPSVLIRALGRLGSYAPGFEQMDPLGQREAAQTEAEALRRQWTDRPNNVPRVIDESIESVEYKDVNTQGAQMLDAREHQNGDAARMFGIPGSLLEYVVSGSSLTYQNRAELKGALVELCLMPLYLEPIEQALSDLLPRSIVARFNVKGFLRADIKTRFEVHGIAIDKGIYAPEYAQAEEGIIPGDVEYAPVPFSPPSAVPESVPRFASLRDVRCPTCARLVVRASGAVEGWCRHCKAEVKAVAPAPALDRAASVPDMTIVAEALRGLTAAIGQGQQVAIAEGAIQVSMTTPPVEVHMPGPAQQAVAHHFVSMDGTETSTEYPAGVTVPAPVIHVESPTVNVPAPIVNVDTTPFTDAIAELRHALTPKPMHRKVDRDDRGLIVMIHDTPAEEIA
jgi:phage portal protein BeeE